MIAIDMEMPKSCSVCPMRDTCKVSDEWDEFDYYYDGRLEGCPLKEVNENKIIDDHYIKGYYNAERTAAWRFKKVLEDIKAEIENEAYHEDCYGEFYDSSSMVVNLEDVFKVIDNHISGKDKE